MTDIKHLHKDVEKIIDHSDKWDKKIGDIKGRHLAAAVEEIIKQADKKNQKAWEFANRAVGELSGRRYAKKHPKELEKLKEKVKRATEACTLVSKTSIEMASIEKKILDGHGNSKKIVHIYPSNKTAKKLIEQWKKSSTGKSFGDYIEKHASKSEKKELKKNTVEYLDESKQEKHTVKFEDHKVKVDGEKPTDGKQMFAMNAAGTEMVIGKKETGKFHHSSLLAGAPVKAAGYVTIKNGVITKVDVKSGHYQPPTKEGKKIVRKFLEDPSRLGKKAKDISIK
ncbi:MAG: hypothetical protein JWO53_500 [Chlamydiia bacterium]|nr:hypothetical protein [Chlamydiia bacterium]